MFKVRRSRIGIFLTMGLVFNLLAVGVVAEEGNPIEQCKIIISVDGQGTTLPSVGEHYFTKGTSLTLEAIPDPGWEFDKWIIGTEEFQEEQIIITLDEDKTAVSCFKEILPPQDTLMIAGEGMGLTSPPAGESATPEEYFSYTILNGKAEITAYSSEGPKDVVIPSTLGGYPVTSINGWWGGGAFSEMGITSVEIPDSITKIGSYAFYGNSLTMAIIPDSVVNIGESAFQNENVISFV